MLASFPAAGATQLLFPLPVAASVHPAKQIVAKKSSQWPAFELIKACKSSKQEKQDRGTTAQASYFMDT